jgi:hypothetical protein
VVSGFFFLAAWAESGKVSHMLNRSSTGNSFDGRMARKGKRII